MDKTHHRANQTEPINANLAKTTWIREMLNDIVDCFVGLMDAIGSIYQMHCQYALKTDV